MNIHEAKTHLSRLVERAAAGEEIIIAKAGKPMARLVAYQPPIKPRAGGFLAGQILETEECWKAETELIDLMTTSPLFPESHQPARVAESPSSYKPSK